MLLVSAYRGEESDSPSVMAAVRSRSTALVREAHWAITCCCSGVKAATTSAIALPSSANAAELGRAMRSEEHTSELQSRGQLVCRLLLEKINQCGNYKALFNIQLLRNTFIPLTL